MFGIHPHYIILGICLILGIGVAGAVIYLLRRSDPLRGLPNAQGKDWFTPIAIIVGLVSLIGYMQERDHNIAEQIAADQRAKAAETARTDAGWLPSKCREIRINLDDCGPRGPGMTDQVVFAIATQPDCNHVHHGCSRIASRGYATH